MNRDLLEAGLGLPADRSISQTSDLLLLEAPGGDGIFNADGTVNMVLIRPCNGRGPGQRIYESPMLQRNAGVFRGWKMFDNHDSDQARRARGHMPRPVSDVAGVIRESFWDPNVTGPDDAKFGYERGGVVGRCALSDAMEAIVRKMPEVVRTSINAQATNLRRGSARGKSGMIVEGIVNDPEQGSVDLVTIAGAGGRVAALLEAAQLTTSAGRRPMTQTLTQAPMGSVLDWIAAGRRRDLSPRIPYQTQPLPVGAVREDHDRQLQEAVASQDAEAIRAAVRQMRGRMLPEQHAYLDDRVGFAAPGAEAKTVHGRALIESARSADAVSGQGSVSDWIARRLQGRQGRV